jgi:prostaglandin reductase 3
LTRGQKVLVTAAAGGTGQFAVQLAVAAGCEVVATAGGPDKVALLRRLGAQRVVDYKREDLKAGATDCLGLDSSDDV